MACVPEESIKTKIKENTSFSNRNVGCKSCMRTFFFCSLFSLCCRKNHEDFTLHDLDECNVSNLSTALGNKLEKNWLHELRKSNEAKRPPKFINAILRTFIRGFIYDGILFCTLSLVLKPAIPILLAYLVQEFDSPDNSKESATCYAMGLVMTSFLMTVVQFHAFRRGQQRALKIRMACSSLVYRKMLKLSSSSLNQTSVGQIINILSNDLSRFEFALINLHYLWIMPLQLILLTYLIYLRANVAGLIGVAAIILFTLPTQAFFGKFFVKFRLATLDYTDERIRLMHEIIKGIQVIKMYVLEKCFEKSISEIRQKELSALVKCAQIRGYVLNFMLITERASLFVTLMAYTFFGNPITASVVFSLSQFFNKIQETIGFYFPCAIVLGAECLVAIDRMETFLFLDEYKHNESIMYKEKTPESVQITELNAYENKGFENGIDTASVSDRIIEVKNVTAAWSDIEDTLTDMSFSIQKGKLYAIVGSIGSGKSSLLHLLLNEIPVKEGSVKIYGSISYGSQDPWLFVDTIRNNILFGELYDSTRYDKVIEVCGLKKDFEKFPFKDQTLVGERGISLSGGQKARISLARTLYKKTDIYLFDDPLSAVDSDVGSYLFQQGIVKFLENKTRILVTHHLHYMKNVDCVIALENGKIDQMGTYNELEVISKTLLNLDSNKNQTQKDAETAAQEKRKRAMSIKDDINFDIPQVEQLEETRTGDAVMSIFVQYWRSGNCTLLGIILSIFLVLGQAGATLCDYWVAYWSDHSGHKNVSWSYDENPFDIWERIGHFNSIEYIYIYGIIFIIFVIAVMIRSTLFFIVCLKISKALHIKMFHKLLTAKMRFFNDNTSGKILNRFSKDVNSVDDMVPQLMIQAIQILLVFCSILILVIITNVWLLIPMILVVFMFWFTLHIYFTKAQNIRVLESIYRSPVYSFASSSLDGVVTIRTSKSQQKLINEFDNRLDDHSSTSNSYIMFSLSLGYWLDIVCIIFLCGVCIIFIYFDQGNTSSSNVGLAISQTLILLGMLQFGVRMTSETLVQMISVERMIHYINIEGEQDSIYTDKFQNKMNTWPSSGKIKFRNLYLKYQEEGQHILKNINLNIESGVKVGIVGRTGAGKSSLIAALFRLAEIEGSIEIDGINTKNIPLEVVRSNISIIPQNPILFSATLRYNLDPLEKYDDEKIWSAIETVGLKNRIQSLHDKITEDGGNLSAGQKQLICLARALLQNNKIMVMDEATANIDPETDNFIQKVIREKFAQSTVLTIAHRINTIIDSDYVLVIDNGSAVNFAHPYVLLKNKNSLFYNIVQQTGPKMAENLFDMAKQSFKKRITCNLNKINKVN